MRWGFGGGGPGGLGRVEGVAHLWVDEAGRVGRVEVARVEVDGVRTLPDALAAWLRAPAAAPGGGSGGEGGSDGARRAVVGALRNMLDWL